MFNIFKKNPIKKLNKSYKLKLEQAMNAQRNGKMALFAELSFEADSILKEIERLKIIEKNSVSDS